MSVTEALLNLDKSLEPTLLGVLAALSLVASAVVWQSQRNRGVTKLFATAGMLFLAALLVDIAVFPMLQEFVTRTTDTDLLGNFTTTLFDTASQYVFLLLGGGTLFAGALSLIKPPPSQESEETVVRVPTEIQREMMLVVRDAKVAATPRYVHQIVGGANLQAFRNGLSALSKLAYLRRKESWGQTVYTVTPAGEKFLPDPPPAETSAEEQA